MSATACGSDDDSSSDNVEAATTDGGESATTDGDESTGDESGGELFLDEEFLEFMSNPDLIPGGPESLELIVETGDFDINHSDTFVGAKG